jgi:hypothetical protein
LGYTYYKYHVFVPAVNPLTFDSLVALFRERQISSLEVDVTANMITLKHDSWSMRIYWEAQPLVLQESQEIAENPKLSANLADLLATCDRRITTAGDDDPEMRYFNDCIFVLEVLNLLENVLRLDLSGQFVDQFGDA